MSSDVSGITAWQGNDEELKIRRLLTLESYKTYTLFSWTTIVLLTLKAALAPALSYMETLS